MNPKKISQMLSEAKKAAPKRKFLQTVDLIVALKGLDMKNSEQHVDFYVQLHYGRGKPVKIAALIGPELKAKADAVFDTVISEKDFGNQKETLKMTASENAYFIAQANLMPKVAQHFGRVLGPRGKMPNPKAGCIVNLKTDLKALYAKLQKTVRIAVKIQPQLQLAVGDEGMDEKILIDNIHTIYDQLIHHLPNGEHNINKVYIKLTMGPPVEVK